MAEKGLYLDGTSVSLPDGSITFANNIELDSNYITYTNADGFKFEAILVGMNIKDIIGKIELPNGVILFGFTNGDVDCILHLELNTTTNKLFVKKQIVSEYFKFDKTRTITGVHTYNYKKENVIVFSDGVDSKNEIRYVNLTSISANPTEADVYKTTLSLNCTFPTFELTYTTGSLSKGSYQFAIRYNHNNTNTVFSSLSPVINITNAASDTSALDVPSDKGIICNIATSIDTSFSTYDLAITYVSHEATKGYIVRNIPITTTRHTFTNILGFESFPVEEILIKPVSILRGETFAINNAALLIGNVEYQNLTEISGIVEAAMAKSKVLITSMPVDGMRDPKSHLFQANEYYVMYVGIYDKKGTLVNTYRLNNLATTIPSSTEVIHNCVFRPSITQSAMLIDGAFMNAIKDLDVNNLIHGVAYLYAEHNETNSVILSNALFIRDGYKLNSSNDRYIMQFQDPKSFRIYPFEYMFNIRSSVKCKIKIDGWYTHLFKSAFDADYQEEKWGDDKGNDYCMNGYHCVKLPDTFMHIEFNKLYSGKHSSDIIALDYIYPLNESMDNLQGDSYYRITKDKSESGFMPNGTIIEIPYLFPHFDMTIRDVDNLNVFTRIGEPSLGGGGSAEPTLFQRYRTGKCWLINQSYTVDCKPEVLYGNLDNAPLTIASPIYPVSDGRGIMLQGDCYQGSFGVKCKNPGCEFSVSLKEEGNGDGTKNKNTNFVILLGSIESKLNINATYIDSPAKDKYLIKDVDYANERYKIINAIHYKHDHYINDDRGKIYNYCLNENGIEHFNIYKNEDASRYIHTLNNRIVRSEVMSSESLTEGWRIFRPINYSDVDLTKGEIVSLKSSDRKLFIQCKYGLKTNELKETLRNNDVNLTYLGTGDLFDRPPYEILYSPNGYIGCINKLHSLFCIFGYVVIDLINRRIFVINEQGVNCITDTYTQEWFKNNLNIDDKINIAVDEFKKIMTLSVVKSGHLGNNFNYDTNGFTNGYTITYNFVTKSWISFYNYVPSLSFFIDELYTIDNNATGIYKQTKNNKGTFYGTKHQSVIKLLFSRPNEGQRLLRSVIWDTEYIDNGVVSNDKTFDSIFIHTDTQATEVKPISINDVSTAWYDTKSGSNKRTFFEYNDIWDIVANKNLKILNDIKTSTQPIASNLKFDYDWFAKSKFINPFFYVVLTYDNESPTGNLNINRIMDNSINNIR